MFGRSNARNNNHLIMLTNLLQQDSAIFSLFGIIKRITFFSRFELCLETNAGYIYILFLANKTLRGTVTLFFSNFS